jgi:hypothetical protein
MHSMLIVRDVSKYSIKTGFETKGQVTRHCCSVGIGGRLWGKQPRAPGRLKREGQLGRS